MYLKQRQRLVGVQRMISSFASSTKDDRVHPGHARKMVAKLQDYSDKETADNVWYYENLEGGHKGAANFEQRAFMETLRYQFLWNNLESNRKSVFILES